MATGDYNFYQLNLIVDTSIPNEKPITLTRQHLNPTNSSTSNGPFICTNAKLNLPKLRGLLYFTLVDIFFNKMQLKKYLLPINTDELQKPNILDSNLINMLYFLFPTKIPSIGNISMSNKFKSLDVLKQAMRTVPISFKTPFSYLHINNKTYTITDIIVINDVINHPVYWAVIGAFYHFETWKLKFYSDEKKTYNIQEVWKAISSIIDKKPTYVPLATTPDATLQAFDNIFTTLYGLKKIDTEKPSIDTDNLMIDEMVNLKAIYTQLKTQQTGYVSGSSRALELEFNKPLMKKLLHMFGILELQIYIVNLNFKYMEDDSVLKKTIDSDTKYKELSQFIREIRQLNANLVIDNEKWRSIISKLYTDDDASKKFNDLIVSLRNCPNETPPNEKCLDATWVGFDTLTSQSGPDAICEIYLQMNVVGGKIDSTNSKQISCRFENERIGSLYQQIKQPNARIVAKKFFVSLDDLQQK